MTRFIFITGGVVSSLGKGLSSAALGSLLQARGYSVRLRKFDPYLNVDPGTMSPYQHGEVYVTDDGAETDLDLGHYERFTGVPAQRTDSVTAGKIYSEVIAKERRGDYLGGTVQVIPHVTDAIKNSVMRDLDDTDFALIEIGGTVGDIEGLPFFEAIRQIGYELGSSRVMFIHLTLLPYIPAAGELKTKPTQHSVKELRSIGIQPDLLLCRSDRAIPESERKKIAQFCNVPEERVIPALDVNSIYEVPMSYHEQGFDKQVLRHFQIEDSSKPDFDSWKEIVSRARQPEGEVSIAIVGKYTGLKDAYKSLSEALIHGGIANNVQVNLRWIDSDIFEGEQATEELETVHGILVPGGFGSRGSEGKIMSAKWARENNTPYLGVCFGFQLATVEFARNVLGLKDANSSELDSEGKHSVIDILPEQKGVKDMGATMRLGDHEVVISGGKAKELYNSNTISERHRHRYEINPEYISQIEEKGMKYTGRDKSGRRMEILELENHPYFMASQFHPEFKSRPDNPSPLHLGLVKAALEHKKTK